MDVMPKDEERRESPRENGLKSGFAMSVDGAQREACVVGNLSETGAMLMVENADVMPEDLVLVIDSDNTRRPAHIVWRNGNTVAVSFVKRDESDTMTDGWIFPPAQSA